MQRGIPDAAVDSRRTAAGDGVIVTVQSAVKRFAAVSAVDGISFAVRRGEIFALLGPNGAGKTTLVRMLTGVLRPDAGTIAYQALRTPAAGEWAPAAPSPAPRSWPQPADLGYLPEDRGLYKDLPILRTLVYFGQLRGLPRPAAEAASREWLRRLGLAERAGEKLDALSKGNQQKVQFIAAIVHRPLFAVLDEPFSGLDPVNQEAFLDLLRELRAEGMTILLSAHQMQLVERVADRVLLMDAGREVLAGTLSELRQRAGASRRIVFRLRGEAPEGALADLPAVRAVERPAPDELAVVLGDGASLGAFLAGVGGRLDILDVRSEQATLHDIYVQAITGRGGGREAAQ